MGLNSSLEPSRVENLLQLETGEKAERKVREIQNMKTQLIIAGSKLTGKIRRNVSGLKELREESS